MGFRFVRLEHIRLDRAQPKEIEQPQVSANHIGAQRCERRQPARSVIPVLGFDLVDGDIQNQILPGAPQLGAIDFMEEGIEPFTIN